MSEQPYFEVHEGTGPYLLLVHGFLSSRAQWMHNIEALKSVCRPVVLELYGHGRSPAPVEPEHYVPSHYTLLFEKIRESLGANRWFVLGYSLGAGLTIRYSLNHPDRVLGSMFTNSMSAFSPEAASREYRDDPEHLVAHYESGGHAALEEIYVHPKHAKRLDHDIKSALLSDCEMVSPAGVARTIAYTNGYASVRNDLHANQVPSMLLHGVYEKRFHEHRDFVAENMPNLRVQPVNAGHAVNAEAANEFNEAVMNFVRQHQDG